MTQFGNNQENPQLRRSGFGDIETALRQRVDSKAEKILADAKSITEAGLWVWK